MERRIDSGNASLMEQEMAAAIESSPDAEIILDAEKLDYISSAGLRVLLSAQKTMNKQGEMKVTGANDELKEIFDVTGFVDILNIE